MNKRYADSSQSYSRLVPMFALVHSTRTPDQFHLHTAISPQLYQSALEDLC